jgi:hypothetical protein
MHAIMQLNMCTIQEISNIISAEVFTANLGNELVPLLIMRTLRIAPY